MLLPHIPDIQNYSEWMDLLSSTPKMQERLAEIKKAQDMVNARLGDYELVSKLKTQQNEITTNLAESREAKVQALAAAKKIREKAKADAEQTITKANSYASSIQDKIKELEQRKSILDASIRENDAKALELANREAHVTGKLKEVLAREEELDREVKALREKYTKTAEIWNSQCHTLAA